MSLWKRAGLFSENKWATLGLTLTLLGAASPAMAAAPANDNFANATVIPAGATSATSSTVDATPEGGEPNHSSEATIPNGGRSIWWRWTPTTSGPVRITTQGSEGPATGAYDGFTDTQLAVYTGSSLNNLTLVQRNEDSFLFEHGWSAVDFPAVAGTTYVIAVDAWQGEQGPVKVNILGNTGGGGGGGDSSFTVTVTSSPSGAVITRSAAQPTGGYTNGTSLTLTAPGTLNGRPFTAWSGGVASTDNPVTFTVDGNKTIVANFGAVTNPPATGPNPLTITVVGSGRVSPVSGRSFREGSRVTLTAAPAKDFIFAGWSGATNSASSRLAFTMGNASELVATFVPNPFNAVRGTYTGLYFEGTNMTVATSGSITLTASGTGAYAGSLLNGARRSVFRGTFDTNGNSTFTTRIGTNVVTGNLAVDLANNNPNDQITGSLVAADESFNATVQLDRLVFNRRTNATSLAGQYNLLFRGDDTTVIGDGYAVATVDAGGVVRITGKLADGTPIAQGTFLSKNGQIPFYNALYAGKGSIIGYLNVDGATSTVAGNTTWTRPANVKSKLYPEGFVLNRDVIGSRFVKPAAGTPLVDLSNALLELNGGNLTTPVQATITVNANNTVTVVSSNRVVIGRLSNGTFRGAFRNPDTSKTVTFEGILLQSNSVVGGGFFLGTNQSGKVTITPGAPVVTATP